MLDPTDEEVNQLTIQRAQTKTTFKNGRYWVEMPWIESGIDPNYGQVLYRFNKLITHLQKENLFEKYDSEIQKLYDNEHIETVSNDDKTKGCYLAHREVLKEGNATTKMRIVFDGSGHSHGNKSLNQCLSKGVDMNPLPLQILTKFRLGKFGVIADLKQAFLQIRLQEHDRKYFKFLWLKNGRLVTYRFTSVPFGATASPFLLNIVKQTEAECMINSRPIGVLEDGSTLTPSHFTNGRRIGCFPTLQRVEIRGALVETVKEWNHRLRATSSFWRSWLRSYLAKLKGRFCKPSHYQGLKVGDRVLVQTPNVGSMEWPEATVIEILPGIDDMIRNVIVKQGNLELRKDVKTLCLLESTQ